MPAKDGAELIAAERERQVREEGWTPEHDDQHTSSEIARAAACYAHPIIRRRDPECHVGSVPPPLPYGWPWAAEDWKPGDRLRDLTKAGALIAAEIDRLQRKGKLSDAR